MTNFTYIFKESNENQTKTEFIMIPKFVLNLKLSCMAKLLYAYLFDRSKLSKKNRWFDSQGKVYIIFSIKSIQNVLECSKNTATKVLNELKQIGLIESKKDEFGKSNKIFVKCPISESEDNENSNKDESDKKSQDQGNNREGYPQELQNKKSYPQKNKTYPQQNSTMIQILTLITQNLTTLSQILISLSQNLTPNHTNLSHTDSINQSSIYNHINRVDDMDKIEQQQQNYEIYQKEIQKNINYDILKEKYDKDIIDDIVNIMCDVMISNNKTTRVNGQDMSIELVKSAFMKLKMLNIEYVLECLKMTPKINNIRAYLITALYNSVKTRHIFYTYAPASENSCDKQKQQKEKPIKQNRFVNYDQREWNFKELEKQERERLQNIPNYFDEWYKQKQQKENDKKIIA